APPVKGVLVLTPNTRNPKINKNTFFREKDEITRKYNELERTISTRTVLHAVSPLGNLEQITAPLDDSNFPHRVTHRLARPKPGFGLRIQGIGWNHRPS
ncbi:hypothetical protein, partial [Phaeobacter gallaeciensis]